MTVESLAMSTVRLLADQVKHLTNCYVASGWQVAALQFIVGNLLMTILSGLDDGQERRAN